MAVCPAVFRVAIDSSPARAWCTERLKSAGETSRLRISSSSRRSVRSYSPCRDESTRRGGCSHVWRRAHASASARRPVSPIRRRSITGGAVGSIAILLEANSPVPGNRAAHAETSHFSEIDDDGVAARASKIETVVLAAARGLGEDETIRMMWPVCHHGHTQTHVSRRPPRQPRVKSLLS